MIDIADQDTKEAIDRLARTPDGLLLYRWLQKIRMGLTPVTLPKRALPVNEGRRSLAADLMAYMAEGIGENDRSCVTFTIARAGGSTGSSAARGPGRRVTADTEPNPIDVLVADYYKPAAGSNGTGEGGAS